jgi:hypothetical protein
MVNMDASAMPDTGGGPGRTRRKAVLAAVAALVVAGTAGGLVAYRSGTGASPAAVGGPKVGTAAVVRTDLSDSVVLTGTLGHGATRTVRGGKDGLVTRLPAVGTTVARGRSLYEVDGLPVPLFYGRTPLFRTLDHEGMTGEDVEVVADNLDALGYDIGPRVAPGTLVTPAAQPIGGSAASGGQAATTAGAEPTPTADTTADPTSGSTAGPASGSTNGSTTEGTADPTGGSATDQPTPVRVRKGDAVLTASLVAAIRRWQDHVGLPATGVLKAGDVAVLGGPALVGSVQAQTGDPAAEPLMTVTGTGKAVTVAVGATDVNAINRGDHAVVILPDGSQTGATVSAIGVNARAGSGDGSSGGDGGTVSVALVPDGSAEVRRLNSAPVQVRFTTKTHKGVLAVPVGALLALSGGGYAVQRPDDRLVAVRTGLFSRGMVEVSGTGLAAGQRVVTTS